MSELCCSNKTFFDNKCVNYGVRSKHNLKLKTHTIKTYKTYLPCVDEASTRQWQGDLGTKP